MIIDIEHDSSFMLLVEPDELLCMFITVRMAMEKLQFVAIDHSGCFLDLLVEWLHKIVVFFCQRGVMDLGCEGLGSVCLVAR